MGDSLDPGTLSSAARTLSPSESRIERALCEHYGTWRADGDPEWADVAVVVRRALAGECFEDFSAYDLRLRSIDRAEGEPINLCSECPDDQTRVAYWSVWLHTPEWGTGNAGATRVLCTEHALGLVEEEALAHG